MPQKAHHRPLGLSNPLPVMRHFLCSKTPPDTRQKAFFSLFFFFLSLPSLLLISDGFFLLSKLVKVTSTRKKKKKRTETRRLPHVHYLTSASDKTGSDVGLSIPLKGDSDKNLRPKHPRGFLGYFRYQQSRSPPPFFSSSF